MSAADRAEIADQVARRSPVDERERTSIERFLHELARLDEPFSEHADATHVTASAIVVGVRGVVLHKHKRLGLWLQPGGHIDPGEAPWRAAIREAQEETGLPVEPLAGPPRWAAAAMDVRRSRAAPGSARSGWLRRRRRGRFRAQRRATPVVHRGDTRRLAA
ncbi:MAG TPA: NUDIX domain-containing protein, partial [Ilumatobacter sp.]